MKFSPYSIQTPLYAAMTCPQSCILEEDDTGILLSDRKTGIWILDTEDTGQAALWLDRHRQPGMNVLDLRDACCSAFEDMTDWEIKRGFLQAVWTGDHPGIPAVHLEQAELADVQFLKEHCPLFSEQELLNAMAENRLYAGFDSRQCIGYYGISQAGRMNLLFIPECSRRQGHGLALEAALIGHLMDNGIIPYAHIPESNLAAVSLQQKLGMVSCPEEICWLKHAG